MAKREEEYKRLELFYQMLVHYLDRPYSDNDLAELLGTSRGNVWRIRKIIKTLEIPIEESIEQTSKYAIRKDFQMRYIHFTPEEMAALYLGARRLQQQTKTSQQYVALALRKLANAMRKPFAESLVKAAGEVQMQEQDAQQEQVFALLVQSWLAQTAVRIYHTKLHGVRRNYVVHPYHIEPSIWNDGNYLIGYSEYHAKIARFKIARIDKAVVTGGKFREATDFDIHHFLRYAWGIWSTDEEPVTVRLRFSKWAIPRVPETIWPNATLADPAADGSRIWEMPVAEWREMVPWVRSWGSDVEVLEPVTLRNRLMKDIRHLVRHYGIGDTSSAQTPADAIAHTQNDAGERHNLLKHLHAVAEMAAEFATPFGGGDLARYLGLWHDIGKFHPAFQAYLLEAEEDPTRKQRGPDHKAAGATVAMESKVPLANLLIQAHHGGLQTKEDFTRWYEGRKGAVTEAITLARQADPELLNFGASPAALFPTHIQKDPYAAEFFLRFVFSALVDADFLDTEQHFNPERNAQRQMSWSISALWQRVDAQQTAFAAAAEPTPVNQLRQEIYTACLSAATLPPGLFRLTVPTGGGKTRSGLAFALKHAKEHGLRRVIIAVPFITITEQTAAVYRQVLETDVDEQPVVLEHHSGAVEAMTDQESGSNTIWNRLAAENWDAPVIVTTTVQLFESLFASGTSRCRKLHRLAGSVILLDEAQALPMGMLDPILSALRELCTHYGSDPTSL
jgi:CRISPR-associated endonuclease/helicase Cas3